MILIISVAWQPRVIIKRELHYLPVFRFFGSRMGNVPVNRGTRGKAITKMKADVESGKNLPGQLLIYPQGTRIAPGVKAPYKIGTGLLYEQTEMDFPGSRPSGLPSRQTESSTKPDRARLPHVYPQSIPNSRRRAHEEMRAPTQTHTASTAECHAEEIKCAARSLTKPPYQNR